VVEPAPTPVPPPVEPAAAAPAAAPAAAAAPATPGGLSLVDVRRLWPDVVEATKTRRRMAWIHLTQNCQVVAVDGNVLTLGFTNAGARDSFVSSGCPEVVHQAAIEVVGADWRIETIVDPGARPEGTPTVTKAATDPTPAAGEQTAPTGPPDWAEDEPSPAATAAREAIQRTRPPGADGSRSSALAAADAEASRDDLDAEPDSAAGEELLTRELGASVIEEIKHP
jgi:DNA polymerase-3 subunit gamma/tau